MAADPSHLELRIISLELARLTGFILTLTQKVDSMAAQLTDFEAAVNAKLDNISDHADGLAADVTFLKEQIATLGVLSDEDKATVQRITDRLTAVAAKIEALDAETTPPAPPSP